MSAGEEGSTISEDPPETQNSCSEGSTSSIFQMDSINAKPLTYIQQEKEKNREYKRKRKERENSEEREMRRAANAAVQRRRRAAESAEQSEARRKTDAQAHRLTRQLETAEERVKRLNSYAEDAGALGKARKKIHEIDISDSAKAIQDSKRARRNELQRKRRAQLSDEEKQKNREKNAAYQRYKRSMETSEEREARLKKDAAAHKRAVMLETPEAKKKRLDKNAEFKHFFERRTHRAATLEKYKETKYYEWVGPNLFAPKRRNS